MKKLFVFLFMVCSILQAFELEFEGDYEWGITLLMEHLHNESTYDCTGDGKPEMVFNGLQGDNRCFKVVNPVNQYETIFEYQADTWDCSFIGFADVIGGFSKEMILRSEYSILAIDMVTGEVNNLDLDYPAWTIVLYDIDGDLKDEIIISRYPEPVQIWGSNNNSTGNKEYLNPCNLKQNYPNPFNVATTITYEVSETGFCNLSVYNVKGQLVETLVSNVITAGKHSVFWDPSGLSSGEYYYQLSVNGKRSAKKAVLIK